MFDNKSDMNEKSLDKTIQKIIVSRTQLNLDYQMVPYDIWGTMAHVVMLRKTNIISQQKAAQILTALIELKKEYQQGKYQLDPGKGAHLTLEAKIIKKAGKKAGLSVHTARSRNDQVMVTEMLYLKDKIFEIMQSVLEVEKTLLSHASNNLNTVMPGYTHMQPAKPTTFAHWCLAYFDAFMREIESLQTVYDRYDMNPLGAAESYGTSWPIDREFTSHLLGFARVWEIPQDAISSRGFFQLNILALLTQIALVASKIASDLLLYQTFEFNLINLGDKVAQRGHSITGSSIMPHKKNPDALELIRATTPQIAGYHQIVSGILASLPTGYNRDSREVKQYISLGLKKTLTSFTSLNRVLVNIDINKKKIDDLIKANYSLATDLADFLSQKSGKPYRLVYQVVNKLVDKLVEEGKSLEEVDVTRLNQIARSLGIKFYISDKEIKDILQTQVALEKRKHIGGTNARITKLLIQERKEKLREIRRWLKRKQKIMSIAKAKTWQLANEIIGLDK